MRRGILTEIPKANTVWNGPVGPPTRGVLIELDSLFRLDSVRYTDVAQFEQKWVLLVIIVVTKFGICAEK